MIELSSLVKVGFINLKQNLMQRYLMEKWLNSRGGRTFDDLRDDYDGLGHYVLMADGKGGFTKVHLVDDIKLSRDLMGWKKHVNSR